LWSVAPRAKKKNLVMPLEPVTVDAEASSETAFDLSNYIASHP
jgi:hypothetical protein